MRKCCFKNIDKAVRIGRANYRCPKCKGDVSLMWFLSMAIASPKSKTKKKIPKCPVCKCQGAIEPVSGRVEDIGFCYEHFPSGWKPDNN